MSEKSSEENNKTLHQNTPDCPKYYSATTLLASGRRSIAFNLCSLQCDLISAVHLLTWNPKAETSDLWWLKDSNTDSSIFPLPNPVIPITVPQCYTGGFILFQTLGLRSLLYYPWNTAALGSNSGSSLTVHTNYSKQRGWKRKKTTITSWSCRGD